MAETQKFDLAELLKGVSDLDTQEQIVRLPLDLLDPDPNNFYSLDGLDELAGNIETVGLLDPIRVRPEGERYVVVSGHRRRAACLLIRDGGSEQFKAGVPCIVEYGEASAAMRKLRLIFANSSTRQLTSAELSRQAEEVTRLLYELKEQGVEFSGRMRDHVAQACQVSKTKLARLHAIRSRTQEYIRDAFDEGELNESVAYEFSKLPQNLQKRIYVNHLQLGYKLEALTAEQVEKLAKLESKLRMTRCKKAFGGGCVYAESRFDLAQRLSHMEGVTANCLKGRCCLGCRNLIDCDTACVKCEDERKEMLFEADMRKQNAAAAREQEQLAAERAQKEHDEECAQIWARIGRAARENGKDLKGVMDQLWESDGDVEQILRFVSGEDKDVQHYAIEFLDDCLIDLADLLGCSVDFLLGRTQEPAVNRGCERAAEASAHAEWTEGAPEKEGWYACLGVWADIPERMIAYWRDGDWYEEKRGRRVMKDTTITRFYPLPDPED